MNDYSAVDITNNSKVKIRLLIIYFVDMNILIRTLMIINIFLILVNILIYINFFFFFLLNFLIILNISFPRININIKLILLKFIILKKI